MCFSSLKDASELVGKQVTVGLLLNPGAAHRLVDMGPPADDAEKV